MPGVSSALASPIRNLLSGTAFVALCMLLAITAYWQQGWSAGDALYMTVITVFTVGYGEVRPIDTPALRAITIALTVFGCTGLIFVSSALVQFFTATQLATLLDTRRMNSRIEKLRDHVIICGFGRIGLQIALELHAARASFVIVERSETRCADAQAAGYLSLRAEATEEDALLLARVEHARALATVLPDDSANVFITLSARSLNRDLLIIARGEAPSTERKLLQAGANRVVLPAHIGAERMAEMLLFAGTPEARPAEAELRRLGLSLEVVVAEPGSPWAGLTVSDIERRAEAGFIVVEIERNGTQRRERPGEDTIVHPGDGVMIVGRSTRAALAGFAAKRGTSG